jgi:protein-disulfide isomerase
MSKQFIGVIVAVILLFVGVFALTGNKSDSGGSKSNSKTLTQHVEGKGTTGVTLVEYGDYQCPFCQQYYATVKQVQTEFNDQIKFQFRNFPLVSIHQNAFAGARAAEAASLQGKFWEMHDTLFENNDPQGASGWVASSTPTTFFNQFAQQLGLNVDQFKKDYASSKVNDLVNADMAEGNRLGITGTPTFFVDGKKVQVSNDVASFEKVIKAEIAKKQPATNTSTTTTQP